MKKGENDWSDLSNVRIFNQNLIISFSNLDVEHCNGPMVQICSECQSINFKDEKPSDVDLELFDTNPEILKELLTDKKIGVTKISSKTCEQRLRKQLRVWQCSI
jgi:hypothetical protein